MNFDIKAILNSKKHDNYIQGKFIFLLPVIILLIGIIVCIVLYSIDKEKMLSIIYWLYTDLKYILNGGHVSDIKLPESSNIIGIRILCWMWIASLIISLFFACKRLHRGSQFFAPDAILKKREPYLIIENMSKSIKQVNIQINSNKLDSLIYKIDIIKEKLSVESDFGVGIQEVIDCENEIARQLQILSTAVQNIKLDNVEESIKAMNVVIININSLLQQRSELKRQ